MKCRQLVAGVFVLSAAGCATIPYTGSSDSAAFSSLYLRGTFNWWEVDELYKVKPISAGLYQVTTKLIADGEPYDFKFADGNWTPGLTCGRKVGFFSSDKLRVGDQVEADCTDGENFKFIPLESGQYRFLLNIKNESRPRVSVEKL